MNTDTIKKTRPDNLILIPTDFSEVCYNAILHGARLAQVLKCQICILHVINKETMIALKKKNVQIGYIIKKLDEYKTYFEKNFNIPVDTISTEGDIFTVIKREAAGRKASLMILGTHGKRGLQYLFGSYAFRVVDESPVPVIIVQDSPLSGGYQNIVFPVNNESGVDEKIKYLIYFSELFKAEIHLLRWPDPNIEWDHRLIAFTSRMKEVFEEREIPFTSQEAKAEGDFIPQVISYSASRKSSLIMIISQNEEDVPEYTPPEWFERLMFNEEKIPVMYLNRNKMTGEVKITS